MTELPVHNYSWTANKILNWVGTDNPEINTAIRKDPVKFQQWINSGWSESDIIEYKFNEHGFRTDSFDQSRRVAIFGSSQTVGVGLHKSQTWVSHFSNKINTPVWNLATGTGGLDTCYRVIKYYLAVLNISHVILVIPDNDKWEYWDSNGVPRVVNGKNHSDVFQQNLSDAWYKHDNNSLINQEKNLDAIKYICNVYNLPLITFDIAAANKWAPVEPIDWSRCLSHVGPRYHRRISEYLVEKLWNQ